MARKKTTAKKKTVITKKKVEKFSEEWKAMKIEARKRLDNIA